MRSTPSWMPSCEPYCLMVQSATSHDRYYHRYTTQDADVNSQTTSPTTSTDTSSPSSTISQIGSYIMPILIPSSITCIITLVLAIFIIRKKIRANAAHRHSAIFGHGNRGTYTDNQEDIYQHRGTNASHSTAVVNMTGIGAGAARYPRIGNLNTLGLVSGPSPPIYNRGTYGMYPESNTALVVPGVGEGAEDAAKGDQMPQGPNGTPMPSAATHIGVD